VFGPNVCTALAYGNGRFVAGGGILLGAVTNTLAYSNDGVTWIGLGATVFTSSTYGLTFGPVFVAAGFGTNTLAISSDGITFTSSEQTDFSGALGVGTDSSASLVSPFAAIVLAVALTLVC
jgi:hypothetical protein